jgi:hypothetical protein
MRYSGETGESPGCPRSRLLKAVLTQEAEGEGFEPSSDVTARNGFRDSTFPA